MVLPEHSNRAIVTTETDYFCIDLIISNCVARSRFVSDRGARPINVRSVCIATIRSW